MDTRKRKLVQGLNGKDARRILTELPKKVIKRGINKAKVVYTFHSGRCAGSTDPRRCKLLNERCLKCLTQIQLNPGEVAEWLKAPLSKSGIPINRDRGFESHPLRQGS
jgi:hypothetical protein